MKNRRLVLCMSVKTGIACLLASIYTSCSVKTDSAFPAPVAPIGTEHWTYNEEISDEFEGTSLDTAKWFDHNPTWIGRQAFTLPPGECTGGKRSADSFREAGTSFKCSGRISYIYFCSCPK